MSPQQPRKIERKESPRMQCSRVGVVAALAVGLCFAVASRAQERTRSGSPDVQLTKSVRLYVFDCGTIHITDVGRFGLKKEEVATSDLSVPSFLILHPKGTLIWNTGAVPDWAWKPTGRPVAYHLSIGRHHQLAETPIMRQPNPFRHNRS